MSIKAISDIFLTKFKIETKFINNFLINIYNKIKLLISNININ
jgi:hypothetical protein